MKTCPFWEDRACEEPCTMRTASGQCQIAEVAEAQKQTAAALAQIAEALHQIKKP